MALAPIATLQTTDTSGTGSLTLIAAPDWARSFQAALGASPVLGVFMITGSWGYEIQCNTFDGGAPGSLTRTSGGVIASSNGGSLVSLPAGTHNVFHIAMPGFRGVNAQSGAYTLVLADLGGLLTFTGSSAATFTLPAVSGWPEGVGTVVFNGGTAVLTIDGNGAETINGNATIALYPGQKAELFKRGSAWDAPGHSDEPPLYRYADVTFGSGAVAVTLSPAFPNGIVSVVAGIKGSSAAGTFPTVSVGAGWTRTGGNLHTDSGYSGGGYVVARGY